MRKIISLFVVLLCVGNALAVSRDGTRSVSDFTGENIGFNLVSVSSSSVSTLASYSTARGALTCVNTSTTTVYLGSFTVVGAAGASSFPLVGGASIQFRNNSALYGVANTGTSGLNVGCITEW